MPQQQQDSSATETEGAGSTVPVVRINLTGDEDYSSEDNPLNFSGIIDASEGTMETSFDDTSVDESMLMDVDKVQIPSQNRCVCVHNVFSTPVCTYQPEFFPLQFNPSSVPIKELTHKQVLPYLLSKWVTHNSAIINLKRMTKASNYRQVTARGKQLMEKLMWERGILPMEKLLIQELPKNERVLNDGLPEYWIVDGNHRVTTVHEVFGKDDIDWVCDVVKVLLPYPSSLFNAV